MLIVEWKSGMVDDYKIWGFFSFNIEPKWNFRFFDQCWIFHSILSLVDEDTALCTRKGNWKNRKWISCKSIVIFRNHRIFSDSIISCCHNFLDNFTGKGKYFILEYNFDFFFFFIIVVPVAVSRTGAQNLHLLSVEVPLSSFCWMYFRLI